jgi:hypothetical protein
MGFRDSDLESRVSKLEEQMQILKGIVRDLNNRK